jgi:hypothetical protein
MNYAFQESGMNKLIEMYSGSNDVILPWMNPTSNRSTRAKKYFGQLTKEQLTDLHFKFRIDFELFDYSIEPYLSYAK